MRKENILLEKPVQVGLTQDAAEELGLASLEEACPELSFLLRKDSSPESTDFLLGEEPERSSVLSLSHEEARDPLALWDFKRRVLAYAWFRDLSLKSLKDLYESFYILKFLCQEIRNTKARKLGKEMASLTQDVDSVTLEKYRSEILSILTYPSTPEKIRNSLWKNYSNQLKKTKNPLKEIRNTEDPRSQETLLQELKILEEEALRTQLFFGTSPVLFLNRKKLQ